MTDSENERKAAEALQRFEQLIREQEHRGPFYTDQLAQAQLAQGMRNANAPSLAQAAKERADQAMLEAIGARGAAELSMIIAVAALVIALATAAAMIVRAL